MLVYEFYAFAKFNGSRVRKKHIVNPYVEMTPFFRVRCESVCPIEFSSKVQIGDGIGKNRFEFLIASF
jgi:hypothetical protein